MDVRDREVPGMIWCTDLPKGQGVTDRSTLIPPGVALTEPMHVLYVMPHVLGYELMPVYIHYSLAIVL